jgi:creatinine amidohydrolase
MAGRPYILAETDWKAVSATHFDVAVLPWGATEAHNLHLPYATDTIQAEAVAAAAANRAWEAGARVVVLPAIPFGVQTGQLDIPLCINVNPSTQGALLADIASSLAEQGVHKLVILNGHGGNDFKPMIRELQPDLPVFLCAIDWYRCLDMRSYFDAPGDHAGELETSVLLHLRPDLVRPLAEAGSGAARTFRIAGLREGWAWTPRQWTAVTDDTGVGDPRPATAAKGERFFADAVARIGHFLAELAAADVGDLYE